MEKTIEELIYEETEKRLREMSSPDYNWPQKADRKDIVGICGAIGICILLIVLCMTGAIA
jgi:hypothetical protein